MENEFYVDPKFLKFKDKEVLIILKNNEEMKGRIIAIDNYFNTVIETEEGIQFIKGSKVMLISKPD
ncbi:Like-Sm ribonucleoprotein core [Methanothermus fervidus DSM 2088]|uniref:Like-Sm ribonucleoprotein core n=1 Tax=Methanothermus fervidus (strain ATCC 43054 / DSM 2088 / JCM 10308 / V24 S) TaxID=523846 RepID=E3GWX1_METFV|nr:LSm family protein [Methanothermus fervidus]ADP76860.1 Like-Sm ribonucleoprotein core [Methanothermus fervidus DSM 2088]